MQKVSKVLCFFFLLAFFASMATDASAQDRRRRKQYKRQNNRMAQFSGRRMAFANARQYVTIGASMNALNYFGDIAPRANAGSTDLSFTRPGIGISSSIRVGTSLTVRAAFMYGRVSSSDYEVSDPSDPNAFPRYARNLQFRNDVKDFSLVGVYDFFRNPYSVIMRLNFTPYVFAGISAFHHNPQGLVPSEAILRPDEPFTPDQAGEWVSLKDLQTEGQTYSNFQVSIPVGAGVRFRIAQAVDLEAEISYRHLFFDYLDDVSTNYVDKGLLGSDLARIMADRSLEPTDAVTGENRFDALVNSDRFNTENLPTYVGADGVEYVTLPGYGQPGDQRGSPAGNDIFLVTTVRLVFIIGPSPFSGGIRPR